MYGTTISCGIRFHRLRAKLNYSDAAPAHYDIAIGIVVHYLPINLYVYLVCAFPPRASTSHNRRLHYEVLVLRA